MLATAARMYVTSANKRRWRAVDLWVVSYE
jgi:hypothetical protein